MITVTCGSSLIKAKSPSYDLSGNWVKGNVYHYDVAMGYGTRIKDYYSRDEYDTIWFNVCTLIGKNDVENNRIYTRDIVEFENEIVFVLTGVVKYCNDTCRFLIMTRENKSYDFRKDMYVKIIGKTLDEKPVKNKI